MALLRTRLTRVRHAGPRRPTSAPGTQMLFQCLKRCLRRLLLEGTAGECLGPLVISLHAAHLEPTGLMHAPPIVVARWHVCLQPVCCKQLQLVSPPMNSSSSRVCVTPFCFLKNCLSSTQHEACTAACFGHQAGNSLSLTLGGIMPQHSWRFRQQNNHMRFPPCASGAWCLCYCNPSQNLQVSLTSSRRANVMLAQPCCAQHTPADTTTSAGLRPARPAAGHQ